VVNFQREKTSWAERFQTLCWIINISKEYPYSWQAYSRKGRKKESKEKV
jgi:hypothetical protein